MDSKRFDQLTKLVASRSSRRSILKGLLGIGGTAAVGAIVLDDSDARTVGDRPVVSTPPPPVCPDGQQECGGSGAAFCCPYGKCNTAGNPDVCCDGAGETFCGTGCCANDCTDTGLCCDPGEEACRSNCCTPLAAPLPGLTQTSTCARDGNTDYCCDGLNGHGDVPCGLDCCDDPLKCCDLECICSN